MRKTKQILTLAAGVIASAVTAQANLVVNGSFESVPPNSFTEGGNKPAGDGNWGYFLDGTVPGGWFTGGGSGDGVLEIGKYSVYGVSQADGENVMELDTLSNVRAVQVLTAPNQQLKVSFMYALRAGVDPSSGSLQVTFSGENISLSPASTAWQTYTFYANTGNGSDNLRFIGTGTSDTYGAVIDAVSVVAVPEPSTYFAAALLGLPLVVSAVRSRMVKTA
jgi:hypothetical protein